MIDFDGEAEAPGEKGESEFKNAPGERGESGEEPHEQTIHGGRKAGEKGRISPPKGYIQPIFPINALGPLAGPCRYITEEMQLSPELAGWSLLGAASLLTQGLYDVETLDGNKPLSLNLMALAGSGEGKSSADGVALRRVREAEQAGSAEYMAGMSEWNALSKRQQDEEPPPMPPYRLIKQATVQGIIQSLKIGVPSQGSFTDEAASMLSGWGMSPEQQKNTSAVLSSLWDGAPVASVLKGDGRTQLYGKRFCCHWMVQPDAATEALNNEMLSQMGLWPRFLIAWPTPLQPRKYKPAYPGTDDAVLSFWNTCTKLLQAGTPEEMPVIGLSPPAKALLIKFWEKMELSRDAKSEYHSIKPFCVRGTEQVCRVAGVQAAFRNYRVGGGDFKILDSDVLNAIKLFTFSLDTWKGIFGQREDLEHQAWADALHKWLLAQPDKRASETAMLKRATPKHLRSRHKRDVAIATLQQQGKIEQPIIILPNGSPQIERNVWGAI